MTNTPPNATPSQHPRAAAASAALLWTGALTLIAIPIFRALSPHARIAWWDLDATRIILPETAITPALSLALDAIAWAAILAIGIAGAIRPNPRHARSALAWAWALLILPLAIAAWHAFIKPIDAAAPPQLLEALSARLPAPAVQTLAIDPAQAHTLPIRGSFDSLTRASAWLTAIAGAIALIAAARAHPPIRRIALAALIALAAALALKGAHQYIIEHARTVADFEANTESTLAAQGVAPGTPAAREFERRLRHPDATGYFALSNVYASTIAASLIAAIGALAAALIARRSPAQTPHQPPHPLILPIAAALALACAAALYFAQSKGATIAFIAALLLLAWLARIPARLTTRLPAELGRRLRSLARPTPNRAAIIIPGLIIAALAAIAIRGLIDLHLGERSLLFRWHYLIASARIWLDHPLVGVGPAEYQAAYAAAKVPLNPEQIESPHSILVDWIATLGLGGIALAAILFALAIRLARSITRTPNDAPAPDQSNPDAERRERIAILAATAIPAALAAYLQLPTTAPEDSAIRAAGLIAMIATALAINRILDPAHSPPRARRIINIACIAAAACILVHAQIEMTLTIPGSAPWAFALIALAPALPPSATTRRVATTRTAPARFIIIAIALSTLIATTTAAAHALAWERALATAARTARPLAEVRQAIEQLPTADARAEFDRLVGTIAAQVLPPFTPLNAQTIEQLDRFIIGFERSTNRATAERLLAADLIEPSSPIPLRRAAALWLAAGDLPKARAAITLLLHRSADDPGTVSTLANLLEAIATTTNEPDDLLIAALAWSHAHDIDPYAVRPPLRLLEIEQRAPSTTGHPPRHWAEIALRNNDYLALDPLKQFPPEEAQRLQSIANP
ncbi:MAG: O-antigen ligase family protein [Phycisphaerales bacterium]